MTYHDNPAFLAALDVMRPEVLTPLAIGLGCTLIALLLGGMLFRQRPQPATLSSSPGETDLPEHTEESSERRVAVRRGGRPVEVQLARDGVPYTYGMVVDRSVGGLCLNVSRLIEVGAVLSVKPSDATPMVPWTEIEVRSCRQEGEGWQIGCRFVRTPPWSVLMHFG